MRTRGQAEFVPAKAHAKLTTREVIRMLRELKGWTQAELARRLGISPTNISLLKNEKVEIGKKRVQQLAKAFDIHPAIIMFPEYEAKEIRQYILLGRWKTLRQKASLKAIQQGLKEEDVERLVDEERSARRRH